MVTTVGDIVLQAHRRAGLIQGDDALLPSEQNNAIVTLQTIILSLPGMANWIDVDTDADYTAGENERIRVTTSDPVTITVSDSVASSSRIILCCNQITLACEGYDDRAPRDGARVGISDSYSDAHATYYYRADIAQWTPATGLTVSSEIPLSADMDRYLVSMLALELGATDPLTVALAQEGRQRMWTRYNQDLGKAVVSYF